MNMLFLLCGMITVGFALCISICLIFSGVPTIAKIGIRDFFFGRVWQPTAKTTQPSYGILPFILTSVYGTAGAVLIGIPIGLLTAVYFAKVAFPKQPVRSEWQYSCLRESLPLCTVLWV